MLFCNEKWPPEKYNKALAELTEAKLERQLQEFLFEITGNEKEIHQGINFCRPAQTQQNDCIDIQ